MGEPHSDLGTTTALPADGESRLAGGEQVKLAPDMRRALQITSGWLVLLARKFNLDEATTRATLRLDGEVIAQTSLGEALDIANDALEPVS